MTLTACLVASDGTGVKPGARANSVVGESENNAVDIWKACFISLRTKNTKSAEEPKPG